MIIILKIVFMFMMLLVTFGYMPYFLIYNILRGFKLGWFKKDYDNFLGNERIIVKILFSIGIISGGVYLFFFQGYFYTKFLVFFN